MPGEVYLSAVLEVVREDCLGVCGAKSTTVRCRFNTERRRNKLSEYPTRLNPARVVHEVDQDNPRWVPVFVDHVSWSEVVVVIQVEVRDSGDV